MGVEGTTPHAPLPTPQQPPRVTTEDPKPFTKLAGYFSPSHISERDCVIRDTHRHLYRPKILKADLKYIYFFNRTFSVLPFQTSESARQITSPFCQRRAEIEYFPWMWGTFLSPKCRLSCAQTPHGTSFARICFLSHVCHQVNSDG